MNRGLGHFESGITFELEIFESGIDFFVESGIFESGIRQTHQNRRCENRGI